MLRADFPRVRDHLAPLLFHGVGNGRIHAGPAGDDQFQNWGADTAANEWRVDVMLEEGDADLWVYRRAQRVSAPRTRMVRSTDDGIPYLCPEGQLLYKALSTGGIRPKDQADFDLSVPRLDDDARAWLAEALTRLRPSHDWIARLS